MPIKLNTASGGGVILTGANTASDKTITVPADDGTMIYANSSGNVGIGTSSPGVNLDVVGTTGVRVKYGAGSGLLISQASSGGSVAINNQANDALLFNTNNAERARIDTSGNLLVGRTNNPSGLSNGLYVTGTYSNTTPSGANVFVNTDGSFFRSTSSLKYKTDVQDYSRGLEDVAKLRPVFYKAKSGISTEQRFAGFIAEEIEEAGLTEFVQYAEDGSPDALSYGNMVALCIKAIQEQQQMIETLQAKVAALEAK